MAPPLGKPNLARKGKGSFYAGAPKGRQNFVQAPMARAVARDVIDTVNRGEKVVMAKIIRRHGYSETTAKNANSVTNTKAYKEEYENYLGRLEKHRMNVISAMERKDLNEEQYRTLADAQTKITHDIQLLSGGKTENVGLEQDRQTLKAIVAAIQLES